MANLVTLTSFLLAFLALAIQAQDELEGLRKNIPGEPGKDYPIYSVNILCKINPRQCGGSGASGAASSGANKSNNSNNGRQKGNNQAQRATKASADFQEEIAQGKIPGTPGKDYPTNNLDALRKKHPNIAPAPAHLITPDFPGGAAPRGSRPNTAPAGAALNVSPSKNPPASGAPKSPPAAPLKVQSEGSGNYCAGGKLEECIKFCPSDSDGTEFSACVSDCGSNCSS